MTAPAGRTVDVAERRARLGVRHRLAVPAGSVAEAAGGVLTLHATDPASVFLAAAARAPAATVATVEDALYEERSVVRLLAMRRTVFVVPAPIAPVVHAGASLAIAAKQRKLLVRFVEDGGVADDGEAWVTRTCEDTLAALHARGEAYASELSDDVPALKAKVRVAEGKNYESVQGVASRVLLVLAAEGHLVRGRPRGSWTSTQYRWAPADRWLPGGLGELREDEARTELVRAWLHAYGPATVADVAWWTGWTLGQTRAALAACDTVEVAVEDGTGATVPGVLLAGDAEPVAAPAPWVALLPALDATVMGWKARDWYLGPHRDALYDRMGNAGPTVWADGRVVGGWAQRRDGELAVRLLEDVGRERAAAIEQEAERLREWIGETRFLARFRTPLERELTA